MTWRGDSSKPTRLWDNWVRRTFTGRCLRYLASDNRYTE